MARTQAPNGDESGDSEHFDPVDKEATRIYRALANFFHVEATSTP